MTNNPKMFEVLSLLSEDSCMPQTVLEGTDITLRDLFAAAAMIAVSNFPSAVGPGTTYSSFAQKAGTLADLMLEERNNHD